MNIWNLQKQAGLFLAMAMIYGGCGSSSTPPSNSAATAPVAAPVTTPDGNTRSAVPVADQTEVPVQRAAEPDLLALEMAAYERAKPVFEEACGSCHLPDPSATKPKKGVMHFAMGSYPFGGHHKSELGQAIRVAIGATDKAATMPLDDPGSIQGEDLQAIVAWSDAFQAASAAGLGHHAMQGEASHEHDATHEHAEETHKHKAKHEHKSKDENRNKSHEHKAKHKHENKHDH